MATKGYKINFATNTLVMNYKFYAASQEYGTDENNLVKAILADFPTLTVVVKAGRDVKTAKGSCSPRSELQGWKTEEVQVRAN